MNNFTTNVGHIVIAVVIIAAACVLALHNTITGGEALGLIGAAGGVSLGGAVASSSAGAPVPSSVATLISRGGGTTDSTPTPTSTTTPTPTPTTTSDGTQSL